MFWIWFTVAVLGIAIFEGWRTRRLARAPKPEGNPSE